jgi:hypothetical protein
MVTRKGYVVGGAGEDYLSGENGNEALILLCHQAN